MKRGNSLLSPKFRLLHFSKKLPIPTHSASKDRQTKVALVCPSPKKKVNKVACSHIWYMGTGNFIVEQARSFFISDFISDVKINRTSFSFKAKPCFFIQVRLSCKKVPLLYFLFKIQESKSHHI